MSTAAQQCAIDSPCEFLADIALQYSRRIRHTGGNHNDRAVMAALADKIIHYRAVSAV
jgi:hypothetical protein